MNVPIELIIAIVSSSALASVAVTVLTLWVARRIRRAQALNLDAQAAVSLAEAAETLAPLYTQQMNRLQADLADATSEIKKLNQRLDKALEDKKRADAYVAALDQKAIELSTTVRRHSAHLADMMLERDQMKAQIEALKNENALLRAEIEKMKSQEAVLQRELAAIHAENKELRQKVDSLTKQNEQLQGRIRELEKG